MYSITVYGTCYKPGVNNYLLLHVDDTGLPQFGKLEKIWFLPYKGPFFVVMTMKTPSFCEHLNAFEISEPEMAQGYDIVSHADLSYFKVYHAHKARAAGVHYIVVMEGILAT